MQALRSQPVDWRIDMSQNRAGEHWGRAFANTGSMLGNAILEYSKEREEKEKKKKEEEAAAQFLTQQGYFKTPEEAKTAVKGMGVDKVLQFMQVDNQRKQLEEEKAAQTFRATQAELKAKQEEAKATALLQFTQGLTATQGMPEDITGPFAAENERRQRLVDTPTIRSGRDVVELGARTGALAYDAPMVKNVAELIQSGQDPRLVDLGNGERAVVGPNGGTQVLPRSGPTEISRLIAERDAAEAVGDQKKAAIINAKIQKDLSSSRGMRITQDPETGKMIVEMGGSDDGETKDPMAVRQAAFRRVSGEAEKLLAAIRPQDLGVKGNLLEQWAAYAPQIGVKADQLVTRNRIMLRQFVEGALRVMSDEKGAFSNRDRADAKALFPTDKITENYDTFKAKIDALNMIIGGRSQQLARSFEKESMFDLDEEQIGVLFSQGEMSEDEVKAVLRYKRSQTGTR